ncbi:hypothetical protein L9G74_09720 [Shewanella sp. C32]|uniref:Uncharacterized protein n=1 Tax=Shewanella electrica TaxID=515560 RepID=A0ABT2FKB7_9GAMM|nr:hypothetical protein [Shewanella electrica]MCH1924835.1 hypothetical protein [Shewanella electrica]MCS4556718.1 hypothetical protein [Shewanella electrica]
MFNSTNAMQTFWTSAILMSAAYLFWGWDGQTSPAFPVLQIILGAVGVARERYLSRAEREVPNDADI